MYSSTSIINAIVKTLESKSYLTLMHLHCRSPCGQLALWWWHCWWMRHWFPCYLSGLGWAKSLKWRPRFGPKLHEPSPDTQRTLLMISRMMKTRCCEVSRKVFSMTVSSVYIVCARLDPVWGFHCAEICMQYMQCTYHCIHECVYMYVCVCICSRICIRVYWCVYVQWCVHQCVYVYVYRCVSVVGSGMWCLDQHDCAWSIRHANKQKYGLPRCWSILWIIALLRNC